MKTSSCKAKGRALQKLVANELLGIGDKYGLVADDIKSVGMGQSGVDILLSPAAKKVFGSLSVECKNVEALNVVTTFHEHAAKYPGKFALLAHKKNRTETLATMRFSDFLTIYAAYVEDNR
jgi:hypothetical protein